MTHKEMCNLFEKMHDLVCITEAQKEYDAHKWRECVNLWFGIFASAPYSHVWAGVRMYIRNGGKYWPWPGEIADLMPSNPYCENEDLKCLSYQTRAQSRVEAARLDKMHKLNPWGCYGG